MGLIERRADSPAEAFLHGRDQSVDLFEADFIRYNENIDVAARTIAPLRYRAEENRVMDAPRHLREGRSNLLGDTDGLLDDGTKLREYWGRWIRAIFLPTFD